MVTFYKKKKLIKLFPRQEVLGRFLNPFLTSWLSSFATPKGYYFLASKDMALFHCYFANATTDKPRFIVYYYLLLFFYGVNVNLSESIRSKMSEVVLNSTLRSEM